MDEVLTATVSHSHLFPGAVLTFREPLALGDEGAEAILIFSDGAATESSLLPDAGEVLLGVEGYTTEAGTEIPFTTWLAEPIGVEQLRIVARADS